MADTEVTKLRVLLVTADREVSNALRTSLGDTYDFFRANNGLEALERIDWVEPDIILTDVDMPTLSGTDTVRAVRKDARYAQIPVLFLLSAQDASVSRSHQFERAAELFVEKPVAIAVVRRKLAEVCETYGVRSRPKRHTADEIHRQFARAKADSAEVTAPRPEYQTLSEQLEAAAAAPRVRVLVVDDEPANLSLIKGAIGRDYELVATADPHLAPDKIIAYQPDIMLIDLEMPRLSGLHLLHVIRLNKRLQCGRVLVMQTPGTPSQSAVALPPDCETVAKPLAADKLRQKLQEVVRRPSFSRSIKRVPYEEVLRREGETAGP